MQGEATCVVEGSKLNGVTSVYLVIDAASNGNVLGAKKAEARLAAALRLSKGILCDLQADAILLGKPEAIPC